VDLEFRYSDGALKYEFVLAPGGNPSAIRMRYEGVEGLALDGATGDLLVHIASGTLRDLAPISYQPSTGGIEGVGSTFVLLADDTVGFRVDDRDTGLPLIIDPGLVFSTFIGCSDRDIPTSMFVDGNGHIWITGSAWKDDFPTTPGAYQTDFSGGDAIVVKMDANGSALLYSTYIGGWSTESGVDLHVDGSGLLYLVGVTGSNDFPVTGDAYCATLKSATDFFILTLDVDNSTMVHSTYFGGSSFESVSDCHFDEDGLVYLAGSTNSSDFPVTNGSFDTTYVGGWTDAFLSAYNVTNASLEYSTLLGDTGTDSVIDIHVEGAAVYLCGTTSSGRFPVTSGAYDTTYAGANDVFVCKLNITSSVMEYSTYLGGTSLEEVYGLAVDAQGQAYVGGDTFSTEFPTTEGAYDRYLDTWSDMFLLKLDATGSYLLNSTFLGEGNPDYGGLVELDEDGCVYVVGFTYSREFPVTEGCYDPTLDAKKDIVMARFDNNLTTLQYATYIGGEDEETANDLIVLGPGSLLLVGNTRSADAFPSTPGAYETDLNGYWEDIFILGMDIDPPVMVMDRSPGNASTGDPFHINVTVEDNWGVSGVIVQYWFGSSVPVNGTCQLVDGIPTNGSWEATIDVPANSLDVLHYKVLMTDGGDNVVVTDVTDIDVIDNDKPTFVEDVSPGTADTDMSYTFNVSVEDNIGVDAVWVEYWYGIGTRINVSMDTEGSSWVHWMIVEATLDDLHYVIWCNDTSGNVNSTLERTVDVIDINGPGIINEGTKAWATTGDPHEFTITAHDNVGLKRATLWYAFPGDELAPFEMEAIEVNPPSGNVLYSLFIDVPSDLSGNITYSYELEDLYGNIFRTHVDIVRVRDDDPPEIVEDLTPGEVGMGEDLTFVVVVSDNVGFWSVEVVYSLADGEPVTAPMVPDGAEDIYSFTIGIAVNETGPISYRFRVMDRGWNEVNGSQRMVSIVDGIPPEILDAKWGESIKGLDLTVVLRAGDNMGVESASLGYRFGDGTETTVEMDENLEAVIPIPRNPAGDLVLVFTVLDAAGNEAISEEMIVPLLNAGPTVDPVPLWDVIEEEDTYLDLAPYISDANDDHGSLTLTSHFGDVTVEGLQLRTLFVYPFPDHTFDLTVSDGEDETDFQITIHIVNVNDAPIVVEARYNDNLFDQSNDDVLLRQGTNDTFWVRAVDEEGDDLEYSWVHDGEVVARGQELRFSSLDEGIYINLTLVVDDGQDTSEYRIYRTSVLSAEDKGMAIPRWIILIVVIGISMVLLVVAVRRFRDGSHRGPSD
jgi:hypothetical protein